MTAEYYQKLLNLQNATFELIEHEDAIVATVYKITTANRAQKILKIYRKAKHLLRETYFLRHFASQLPVPQLIQIIEPTNTNAGAILMECLPGSVLKKEHLTKSIAYELGSLLARIHAHSTPGYGDPTDLENLTLDPRLHFTAKFEEELNECISHLPESLIHRCKSYYYDHLELLDSVDGPCMIHRDFRPGNVMVHEGKLQGIIDWSSGRFSFAEDDFCFLDSGEWSSQTAIKASFLSGYGSVRKAPHFQQLMPLLRLNRAIAVIGFTVKQGTWNTTCSPLYIAHRRLLDSIVK